MQRKQCLGLIAWDFSIMVMPTTHDGSNRRSNRLSPNPGPLNKYLASEDKWQSGRMYSFWMWAYYQVP